MPVHAAYSAANMNIINEFNENDNINFRNNNINAINDINDNISPINDNINPINDRDATKIKSPRWADVEEDDPVFVGTISLARILPPPPLRTSRLIVRNMDTFKTHVVMFSGDDTLGYVQRCITLKFGTPMEFQKITLYKSTLSGVGRLLRACNLRDP